MDKKRDLQSYPDPIADPARACNQRCIFCSAEGKPGAASFSGLKKAVETNDTMLFGFWEPTLSRELPKWLSYARDKGVKSLILRTNGVLLDDAAYCGELIEAGVTLFYVNFPSHREKLSDCLTQTPGFFKRRVKGIQNLISLGAAKKTALVFVINAFNYKTMPDYIRYVAENFPGILYIALNNICIRGAVRRRKGLVPTYSQIRPYLAAAVRECGRRGVPCLVDDIPLCLMKGFETASVDASHLANSEKKDYSGTKQKRPRCAPCTYAAICSGPQEEYVKLHGDSELEPSVRPLRPLLEQIRQK